MYSIKNGILYRNETPTIGVGTSYYASYHPEKVTVPEGGDKFGEMLLDVRGIAEAGFNHVRVAANGKAHWEGDRFVLDTAFTDALVDEIGKNDMATQVRLQGYTMNQRGHGDALPVNELGEVGETDGFVQDTLNHPALNADMDEATRQQAQHFAARKDVIGFQMFNEPSITRHGTSRIYDYHPLTIAAWRKWLVEKHFRTEEEAANAQPPRAYDGSDLFALWRQFGVENMSSMLSRLSVCAKEAAPGTESFTNFIVRPFSGPRSSCAGDWFYCAKDHDLVGMDFYNQLRGEEYYGTMFNIDWFEGAAAANGKHCWCIETVLRTHMTAQEYEREMIACLGSGYKGVNFYLWRADLGGPEVQLGGMVWNNRTKTFKFDDVVAFNKVINRLGPKLALCEKRRDGVAILHSLHGAAHCEEFHERDGQYHAANLWYRNAQERYTQLKKMGVSADFVDAANLKENRLNTRLLFIPVLDALSEEEKAQVAEFAKTHAVVLADHRFHPACGEAYHGVSLFSNWCYRPVGTYLEAPQNMRAQFRLPELMSLVGIRPALRVTAKDDAIGYGWLESQGVEQPYYVACLLNINVNGTPAEDGVLTIDETQLGEIDHAVYVDRLREIRIPMVREKGVCRIELPVLDQVGGGFVFLYKKMA